MVAEVQRDKVSYMGTDARDGHHLWEWCWGPQGLPRFRTPLYLNTHVGKTRHYLEGPREPLPLKDPQGLEARYTSLHSAWLPLTLSVHSASALGLHLEGAIPQGTWGPLGQRLGGHRDPGSLEGTLLLQRERTCLWREHWGV